MFNNRQHNRRNNEQDEGGLKSQKVHSNFAVGVWREFKQVNELCMIVKTNRELCPHIDSTFLKNAREKNQKSILPRNKYSGSVQ